MKIRARCFISPAVRAAARRWISAAPAMATLLALPAVEPSRAEQPRAMIPDQQQTRVARGHAFDASTRRTQEFVPAVSLLCHIAVNLHKTGPAGSVVIEIRSGRSTLLWQGTIPEAD